MIADFRLPIGACATESDFRNAIGSPGKLLYPLYGFCCGRLCNSFCSIMKCVSTGSYILVYSYLDLSASRLKVTNRIHTLGHAF